MWKNGKEGDTEGDESWKEKKEKTGDGRRETIEAEEKMDPRKKGGCGRRWKGSGRTGKKRRAGSCRNVVGKTEWEEKNNCCMA